MDYSCFFRSCFVSFPLSEEQAWLTSSGKNGYYRYRGLRENAATTATAPAKAVRGACHALFVLRGCHDVVSPNVFVALGASIEISVRGEGVLIGFWFWFWLCGVEADAGT